MTIDRSTKAILIAIAVLLGIIAVRPYVTAQKVEAQESYHYDFYIEPGTWMLRSPGGDSQVLGKVMVNMKTGDVWGFPTSDPSPYPVDFSKSAPPVSKPVYLGRFDFAAAIRNK